MRLKGAGRLTSVATPQSSPVAGSRAYFSCPSGTNVANGSKFEVIFQLLPEVLPQKTPAPARREVLPSPNGSQAMPTRGETWCQRTGTIPRVMPGSPGNSTPSGAEGFTLDCTPCTKVDSRFAGSVGGVWISQRNPRLNVRRGKARKLSWTNDAVYQLLLPGVTGASCAA